MRLTLVLHCKSAVTASFGFSFLDKHGRPASDAIGRITFTFSPEFDEYGFFPDNTEGSEFAAELVDDDYITVLCSVTITSNSQKEVPKQSVNGLFPFSINEDIADFLDDEEMTDISFEVDGELFTAHKSILSARSAVFTAEFFGKMKSIQIKDIRPTIFKAMLHFIYFDSLPDTSDADIPMVTQVQHLYKAADRYALWGLRMICEEVLMRNVSVDTVISSLALAEEHDCEELKDACLDFASKPEILVQLALTTEYAQLMLQYPSLLKSLDNYASNDDDFCNLISKKQKTN